MSDESQAKPPPRLLERLRHSIRYLHYSRSTEEAYVHWVRAFIRFHDLRHPTEMAQAEVEAFLAWLAVERHVAPSTHKQALSALVFLYQKVLGQHVPWMNDVGRPQRQPRLPVVLSVAEVTHVLASIDEEHRLLARLLYGTGMRLIEALRLRVKDVEFEQRAIVIREGKGFKDRVVMLPASMVVSLRAQIEGARRLWLADRAQCLAGVHVPHALARKYPRAPMSWPCPQAEPSCDPRSDDGRLLRRHHAHEQAFQRAFKRATAASRIAKPATPHTLRHYAESMKMPSGVGKALAARRVEGFLRALNSAYSGALQSLEERHQLVVGLEPNHAALVRFDLVESGLLDLETRIEIDLRCLDRLVAEPQGDHAAFRTGLQQFHGHRVSQHVRRHMLVAQRRAALAGSMDVLGQQVLHAIGAQAASARAGEDDRFIVSGDLAQPGTQDIGSRSGQRRRSLLASLAEDPDVRAGSKADSAATQPRDLRQAQPGLDGQEHERVVAPTRQGAQVRGAQEGIDLLTREKPDLRPAAALAGNGQHSLNLCRVVWHLEGRVSKERANGSQAQVAAAGTDAAAVLQVFQERGDQRCIDLFELQVLRRDAKPLLREAQELPKAVA